MLMARSVNHADTCIDLMPIITQKPDHPQRVGFVTGLTQHLSFGIDQGIRRQDHSSGINSRSGSCLLLRETKHHPVRTARFAFIHLGYMHLIRQADHA
ncbi:hypothetical protein SDC9_161568 [bioreactor metagenome]|uniref:Uncharacterized protein n=1 Tax=bioreactor metagenome TaxID=1076179 RepID=A0A645FL06_9ZZZZ